VNGRPVALLKAAALFLGPRNVICDVGKRIGLARLEDALERSAQLAPAVVVVRKEVEEALADEVFPAALGDAFIGRIGIDDALSASGACRTGCRG
jgi:hypothetical protein